MRNLNLSPNCIFQIKADEMDMTWENEGHKNLVHKSEIKTPLGRNVDKWVILMWIFKCL